MDSERTWYDKGPERLKYRDVILFNRSFDGLLHDILDLLIKQLYLRGVDVRLDRLHGKFVQSQRR